MLNSTASHREHKNEVMIAIRKKTISRESIEVFRQSGLCQYARCQPFLTSRSMRSFASVQAGLPTCPSIMTSIKR